MTDLFLLIMGVQGSGKGTQAAYIVEKYGIPHVSTGDLFRAMRARTDPLAQYVNEELAAGRLVDAKTTNEVLKDRLEQLRAQGQMGALLDGYPRNMEQATFLEDYLASRDQSVTAVLLLELDLYVAFKRSFGRVTAKDGSAYNYFGADDRVDWNIEKYPDESYPPRLVATLKTTGEQLKRRNDDADAFSVIQRIEKFLSETQPVLPHYEQRGLVRRINADQPIEAVRQQIFGVIEAAR